MLNCQVCHEEPAVAVILDRSLGDDVMVYVGKKCLKKGDLPFLQYNRMGALIMLDNGTTIPLIIHKMTMEIPAPVPIGRGQYQYRGGREITLTCVLLSIQEEGRKVTLYDIFNRDEHFKIRIKERLDDGNILWANGYGRIITCRASVGDGPIIAEEVTIVMDTKALSMGRTVK